MTFPTPRSFAWAGLLGHGHDVAVGADFSAPPLHRSRELGADGRGFPDAAVVVGRQLLGAGDRAGRRPLLRLLHRAEERRPAVRRGRRCRQARRVPTPTVDRWSARTPVRSMPRAIRDENGRRYLVWKEDGNSRKLPTPLWAQPLSDDGLRLVGEKQRAPAERGAVGGAPHRGPYHPSPRRLVLHLLFGRRAAAAAAATTSSASPARASCSARGNATRATRSSPATSNGNARDTAASFRIRPGARSSSITRTRPRRSSSSAVRRCSTRSRGTRTAGRRSTAGSGPSGSAPSPSASAQRRARFDRRRLHQARPSIQAGSGPGIKRPRRPSTQAAAAGCGSTADRSRPSSRHGRRAAPATSRPHRRRRVHHARRSRRPRRVRESGQRARGHGRARQEPPAAETSRHADDRRLAGAKDRAPHAGDGQMPHSTCSTCGSPRRTAPASNSRSARTGGRGRPWLARRADTCRRGT